MPPECGKHYNKQVAPRTRAVNVLEPTAEFLLRRKGD
jgi:hypothetical protein